MASEKKTHSGPKPQKIPKWMKRSGIAVGRNRGHKTTPHVAPERPRARKGRLSKRTAFVREVVKEVAGLAPYEKRIMELLRTAQDKRARKLAKRRLGTIRRAKAKVDEINGIVAQVRSFPSRIPIVIHAMSHGHLNNFQEV